MLIKLQRNVPLDAKFGLHFGRFAQLPTTEEFFRFQTLLPDLKYRLQALDISSAIPFLKRGKDSQLVIEIPVLGFTDPVLDYDVNPWFALPIVINGFVANAQQQSLSSAQIWFKDLMAQSYPLVFDPMKRIDYKTIAAQLKKNLYSTLQSITYAYTRSQVIDGEHLEPLPQKNYKNKILLCLPQVQMPFKLKIFVLENARECFQQELFISPTVMNELEPEIQASWKGIAKSGTLEINYSVKDNVNIQQAQQAKFDLLLPQKKNLKLMLQDTQEWFTIEQGKPFYLTQYYGLSTTALSTILQALIPFDYFFQAIKKWARKESEFKSYRYNDYAKNTKAACLLYQYLLSGFINRSIPIYALTEYVKNKKKIYEILNQININQWDLSDQIVYKQYLYCLCSKKISFDSILDGLDYYLSFGNTPIEGNITIKTSGVSLPKNPVLTSSITLSPYPNAFPSIGTTTQALESILFTAEKPRKQSLNKRKINTCVK